jgi:hypothetical protein
MATSEFIFDPATQGYLLTLHLSRVGDELLLDQIQEAMKAAGEQFVKDNMDKILAELKTENIEKYVAEYVAKNLELTIKEKDNA